MTGRGKPARVLETHLLYLDALRESGVTNMYGACPYLIDEFPELSEEQAGGILVYWMRTFTIRHQLDGGDV